ncbi:MAG: membrane protein insertase YidC, partial [Brevundimonas sp.]
MNTENSRNTIIFVVITGLILILYQLFVLEPQAQQRRAAQAEQAVAAAAGLPVGDDAPTAGAGLITDRAQALAASARVPIETPTLSGSLSLLGGRVDDLFLSNYRQTLDADSPPVELFRPQGM